MKARATPGGRKLRALRDFRGKTQLDVEFEASLGMGYLQRVESGRVQQPERETLERILDALGARFTARREVLEAFGYGVDAPIPTAEEVAWAISICQPALDRILFPGYLLDCANRLLYWNALVPNLFDAASLAHGEMHKMVFDVRYSMRQRIVNADEFLPAQIRVLRYEMQRFHDEPWWDALIAELMQIEEFHRRWESVREEPVHIAARPLTPLELEVKNKILRFRLVSEPFAQDHRFRMIFFLPTDALTSEECIEWSRVSAAASAA